MKCPCHSGKPYKECCKPYHTKEALPETPEKLMRSRYSAYALNLPDYIIETTLEGSPAYNNNLLEWRPSITSFSKSTNFENLTIESTKIKGDKGEVTFHATLSSNGADVSFTELSLFEQINGKWFYAQGHPT